MTDNNEIIEDIESAGNTATPPVPLHEAATTDDDDKYPVMGDDFWGALKEKDWNAIEEILDRKPEAINSMRYGKTALNIAILYNRPDHIINQLVDRMSLQMLVYFNPKSVDDSGVLSYAIYHERFSVVRFIILKHPTLLNTRIKTRKPLLLDRFNYNERTPILYALFRNKDEMAHYLLKIALNVPEEFQLPYTDMIELLEYAFKERKYDFAYNLIVQHPKLAHDVTSWKTLMEYSDNFPCKSRLSILQSIIYSRIHIDHTSLLRLWKKAEDRFSSEEIKAEIDQPLKHRLFRVPGITHIRRLKLRHHQILELLKKLCMLIKESSNSDSHDMIVNSVFGSAVHNGISDIVDEIFAEFPTALDYKDADGKNVLHLAVSYRDGKTFRVLKKQSWGDTVPLDMSVDRYNNNVLHLVAKTKHQTPFNIDSREVLQLQREFQWYKEMHTCVHVDLILKKNLENKIPSEIFYEEHQDMLKSETEWITSMANSCMVAGSLIAAVVFAAAITLPGGNKEDGFPNFSKQTAFKVFAVVDTFALVSSLTTVVTFLSIFTTRFSAERFEFDLPNRLIIGLVSLLLSVMFMMIAFSATIYLLFGRDHPWIIYPTVVVSFVPVFFSGYMQMPSLFNLIKSTYFRSIFKEEGTY